METLNVTKKSKKNIHYYMRFLHNNVGFFIVGLVIIYSLSGIVQTYRDRDIFKTTILVEKKLVPGLDVAKLKDALQMRSLTIDKTEGGTLYFKDGQYNTATGAASYTKKEFYSWILPFTELHKTSSKGIAHYFTTLLAVSLLFMSVSAFWMFKPGTKLFSRGVYLTVAGIVAAILLLLL